MEDSYKVEMRNNYGSRIGLYSLVKGLTKTDDFWFLGMRKYRALGHPLSVALSAAKRRNVNKQRVQVLWNGYVGRKGYTEHLIDLNLNDMGEFVRTLYEDQDYSHLVMGFDSWGNVGDVEDRIEYLSKASPDFEIKFKRSKIKVSTNIPSLEGTLEDIKSRSDKDRRRY